MALWHTKVDTKNNTYLGYMIWPGEGSALEKFLQNVEEQIITDNAVKNGKS